MTLDRRELLGAIGGLAASRALGLTPNARHVPVDGDDVVPAMPPPDAPFPRKADFALEPGTTYLNAAYTHPIPRVSAAAARRAAERRSGALPVPPGTPTPKQLFAQLIAAKPSEIAHVSSTSAGENLVVRAVGLDHRRDGNVVTDGLHFEGALMHLDVLRRDGLDVRVVAPTADARIEMRDLERVIDRGTRLVQISATAMYNGFQHDLRAVADLAHAHGALVYADIVHAAGAEPLDIRATGVDFAACSSFKWLMGDFGLGFLYAREEAWDRITRPVVGYYQASAIEPNYPPHLPAGPYAPVTYELGRSAAGFFEMGSLTGSAETGVALLATSLAYVRALGVERIQAHRLPLVRRLQQEMPRLGFTPVTPADSTAGNVTFARAGLGASDIPKRLAEKGIDVRVAADWIRVSPSVYNDMADIERLLEALA
ncbi:MAG: aminotransferase class V-fold PLP-dependent enzyme [Gemmatimonadetes bacterium]|nr:aminotransferase class V-fold PLP-dependent enzyme [Gemmatimonadota bacterium]